MNMEMRYLPDRQSTARMNAAELRKNFLVEPLFVPDEILAVYCDADRAIVGGAEPTDRPLKLAASAKEMGGGQFTDRREVGILNLGEPAGVRVLGAEHPLGRGEMLYVGRGSGDIEFLPAAGSGHPLFYFVSFPAHAAFPLRRVARTEAEAAAIGSPEGANRRTINRYIHAGGAKSCQLVMGVTHLDTGSVWNTMPPHTHQRRMEIYLYFGLQQDECVVHLMGAPDETRHILVRNMQAVISPSWSIHSGAGTARYSFVWAMGGENQEFSDMDQVAVRDMK